MAARASPLPSWVVLDSIVRLDVEAVQEESEWAIMECASKKAYGCGDDGDSVVEGLTLLARLAHPPGLSALSIRASDDVVQSQGRTMYATLHIADKNLIVLSLSFPRALSDYYLIYDATDTSLSMIPQLSFFCRPSLAVRPLPVRRADGDGDYRLVLMARLTDFDGKDHFQRDVHCVWPPSSPSSASITAPWELKQPVFPGEMQRPSEELFFADAVFSFNGKAFWADLMRGVLFCDCIDVLAGSDFVEFHFIDLPPGCRHNLSVIDRCNCQPWMSRTMGCVGGSIKFVSVDGNFNDGVGVADRKVTIWTLTPNLRDWRKDEVLLVPDLYKLEDFKKAGLPTAAPPLNPVLSAQKDGVLYLVIGDYYNDDKQVTRCNEQYMLSVDMRSKSLLSSELLPSWPHFLIPHLFGSDFFKYLDSRHLRPLAVPGLLSRRELPEYLDRGLAWLTDRK